MRRTVVKVIDGDTFVVNRKIGNTNKVRLANADAPELYQYGGRQAANVLRKLIANKKVTITPVARSYDRVVANVRVRRKSVNRIIDRLF